MSPNVLPGFTFDRRVARFRDTARGQFVSRDRIRDLLDAQVRGAERRLGDIAMAVHDKSLAPGVGQMLMRDELRRLSLQNIALAKGGMDKLDFRDYGRAGRQLRDTYGRVEGLMRDVAEGRASVAQAMQRVRGYAGEARQLYYATERDTLRATGRQYEQRRRLNPAEHCSGCVRYASMGWRPLGELPTPGDGSTPCRNWCRCTLETREVTPEMAQERRQAALAERMAT